MYEALRDLAPDLLLPGVERVPVDSATLLETNPRFIEAYMAGLNHEMSRELLWREYPSDFGATAFRRFWGAGGPGGSPEMPEVHRWAPNSAPGSHLLAGSGENQLVLLLRGELLRHYPETVIYAVPAIIDRKTLGTQREYPVFLGQPCRPTSDLHRLRTTRGHGAGRRWRGGLVFFQTATAADAKSLRPRRVDRHRARCGEARELERSLLGRNMAASGEELDRRTHAPVAGRRQRKKIGPLEWSLNSGHMAAIMM